MNIFNRLSGISSHAEYLSAEIDQFNTIFLNYQSAFKEAIPPLGKNNGIIFKTIPAKK